MFTDFAIPLQLKMRCSQELKNKIYNLVLHSLCIYDQTYPIDNYYKDLDPGAQITESKLTGFMKKRKEKRITTIKT